MGRTLSLIRDDLVSLRDPYESAMTFLTHTRALSSYEEKISHAHRQFWDSGLPVLVIAMVWVFVEGVLWMRRK